MSSPDAPAETPSHPTVVRYERLLAFRLIDSAKRLCLEARELCEQTGLLDNWLAVEQSTAEFLFRIVKQPILDSWVQTAEALLSVDAHKRYPHAHPSRLLKDFSRLLLSWAADMPGGFQGEVQLLGRRAFPLLSGSQLLLLNRRGANEKLRWRVDNQVLTIRLDGVGTIAEVDLSNPQERRVLSSQCALKTAPAFAGLTLDVWTPEFTDRSNDAPARSDFDFFRVTLEHATGLLNAEQERQVSSVCRCVTLAPAGTGWVAGLIKVSAPAEITPESLVELSHRDLIRRLLKITPIRFESAPSSTVGDFRETFIGLYARRAMSRSFGKELSDFDDALWKTFKPYVLGLKYGERLLRELGEDTSPPPSTQTSDESPTFTPAAAAQGTEARDTVPPPIGLRKTRAASDSPVDWHAPDSLLHLPTTELARIYERVIVNWRVSESSAYCAAVISYLLENFEDSRKHLLKCLEFDSDVEEYWHLLAFSLRHLGQFDGFDQIIFGRTQQASDTTDLPGEITTAQQGTGAA